MSNPLLLADEDFIKDFRREGQVNIPTEAIGWIIGHDTGTSSKTIWAVLAGGINGPRRFGIMDYSIPLDGDDFGRCYRLINLVPGWHERLGEVAKVFPAWQPIIREWETLVALYNDESHHALYKLLSKLGEESRILDGWVRTGPSSWQRSEE